MCVPTSDPGCGDPAQTFLLIVTGTDFPHFLLIFSSHFLGSIFLNVLSFKRQIHLVYSYLL